MPPSNNYVWTNSEVEALMARLAALEQQNALLALRGSFAYMMNDGSGGALPSDGGIVRVSASQSHSYSLAAPNNELAVVELFNPTSVTHYVGVSGGAGFTTITLQPNSGVVLYAATDGVNAPQWHIARNASVS